MKTKDIIGNCECEVHCGKCKSKSYVVADDIYIVIKTLPKRVGGKEFIRRLAVRCPECGEEILLDDKDVLADVRLYVFNKYKGTEQYLIDNMVYFTS